MPDLSPELKAPTPQAISDICHDTADALEQTGQVLPAPAGPIVRAAGAITEVACDIYDMKHEIEPKANASSLEEDAR